MKKEQLASIYMANKFINDTIIDTLKKCLKPIKKTNRNVRSKMGWAARQNPRSQESQKILQKKLDKQKESEVPKTKPENPEKIVGE